MKKDVLFLFDCCGEVKTCRIYNTRKETLTYLMKQVEVEIKEDWKTKDFVIDNLNRDKLFQIHKLDEEKIEKQKYVAWLGAPRCAEFDATLFETEEKVIQYLKEYALELLDEDDDEEEIEEIKNLEKDGCFDGSLYLDLGTLSFHDYGDYSIEVEPFDGAATDSDDDEYSDDYEDEFDDGEDLELETFAGSTTDSDEEPIKKQEMVFIEGGTLTLGSDEEEDHNPKHEVTLDSFYMANFQVTQELYESVTGENPSRIKGSNNPVEIITWYKAIEFCNKLSIKEELKPAYTINKDKKDPNNLNDEDDIKWTVECDFTANGYRLPTEAEWEYAARGGTKSQGFQYAGSNSLEEVAWYIDNAKFQTHSVGEKKSNELGLYDMSGNVWEWCWDWYEDIKDEENKKNPTGAASGSDRVRRGGCYIFSDSFCAVSFRSHIDPCECSSTTGFRVCRNAN